MPDGNSDDLGAQHFDSFYRVAGRDSNVLPRANQAPTR